MLDEFCWNTCPSFPYPPHQLTNAELRSRRALLQQEADEHKAECEAQWQVVFGLMEQWGANDVLAYDDGWWSAFRVLEEGQKGKDGHCELERTARRNLSEAGFERSHRKPGGILKGRSASWSAWTIVIEIVEGIFTVAISLIVVGGSNLLHEEVATTRLSTTTSASARSNIQAEYRYAILYEQARLEVDRIWDGNRRLLAENRRLLDSVAELHRAAPSSLGQTQVSLQVWQK
jgi:hypothetical protein